MKKAKNITVIYYRIKGKKKCLYTETSPTTHLFVRSLPNVQQLAPQREHAVVVAPDDAQTRDGQGLSRVSLGQDQSTVEGVPRACVVGVVQLRDSLQLGVFGTRTLLVHLLLSFEAHPREDRLNHATLAGLRGEGNYRYVSTLSHPREDRLNHATLARLQGEGVQIHVNTVTST